MRKSLVTTSLALMLCLFCMTSSVFAGDVDYTKSIMYQKTLIKGVTVGVQQYTIDSLTDGNPSNSTGIGSWRFWYDFATPQTADSLYASGFHDCAVEFYDATGTLLYKSTTLTINSMNTFSKVIGISRVVLYSPGANDTWYEVGIFSPQPTVNISLVRGMNSVKSSVTVDNYDQSKDVSSSSILPYQYSSAVDVASK